jgi:hypothetical protein
LFFNSRMDDPRDREILAYYPYVVVRIGCDRCTRKGAYRLARLAAKFGPDHYARSAHREASLNGMPVLEHTPHEIEIALSSPADLETQVTSLDPSKASEPI